MKMRSRSRFSSSNSVISNENLVVGTICRTCCEFNVKARGDLRAGLRSVLPRGCEGSRAPSEAAGPEAASAAGSACLRRVPRSACLAAAARGGGVALRRCCRHGGAADTCCLLPTPLPLPGRLGTAAAAVASEPVAASSDS